MLIEYMLQYALSCLSEPYIWGSHDCSQWVQKVLQTIGKKPQGDNDCDGLYSAFKANKKATMERGDLLFYGSTSDLTHVAIYLGDGLAIECGGGGRECVSENIAFDIGACVRVVPALRRSDLKYICGID